jgi:hypothetical protein
MDSSQFDVIDHVFDLLTWVGYRVCLRLFFYLSIISADVHSLHFVDVFNFA